MQMKERMIATGSVRITTSAEGRWNRKTMQTTLTAMESLRISSFRVSIARPISSERS